MFGSVNEKMLAVHAPTPTRAAVRIVSHGNADKVIRKKFTAWIARMMTFRNPTLLVIQPQITETRILDAFGCS